MSNTKEFAIILKNPDKCYYPGDFIHGQISLNLKKSVDIQYISVNFNGFIEGCGDKVTLINDIKLLGTPINKQKYTTLNPGICYSYDFEFKIPADKRLPSSTKIPKVAKITYTLTATHKKPMFKLSHTLSNATQEIIILDMINILLPDYRVPVKMNKDLGFINGSKLSQWCINVPKSAFTRGENIKLKCQINNFPAMEKSKAVKVSLSRQTHRTSSAKILENKVLSSTTIDLDTKDNSSSQCIPIELHVPLDTPPSIFPDSGRSLSVSYVIHAELKMKGVKSAIKLKSVYKQEVAIVIGTFPIDNIPIYSDSNNNNTSQVYLHTLASVQPSLAYQRNSTTNLLATRKISPPVQHQVSYSDFDNIKPLPRLEEITQKRSYGSNNSSSSSSSLSSPTSPASLSPTPSSMPISSYQQEFDDYIPTTPLRRSSFSSARSSLTASIDRSLTPLPSIKSTQVNPYNTVSYLNRKSSPGPSLLSTTLQAPHEIGPNDIIAKQGNNIEKPHVENNNSYFNVKTLETSGDDEDETNTPELLSRNNTISTASSNGLTDPFQAISSTKTAFLMSPIDKN